MVCARTTRASDAELASRSRFVANASSRSITATSSSVEPCGSSASSRTARAVPSRTARRPIDFRAPSSRASTSGFTQASLSSLSGFWPDGGNSWPEHSLGATFPGMSETRTTPQDITAGVVASFDECPDPRLREIMESLTRHLHEFARDVRLTQDEWTAAVRILTATGHITDDRRQEFILWSDSMGLSMLVDALANPLPDGATESTVLGPFYVPGAPERDHGANIAVEPAGTPLLVHGHVRDRDGDPIAGAELDVWQNGDDRLYAVQKPEGPEDHLRGRFRTRDDGSYAFLAVRPVPYPILDDGPVGQMLEATGRHPWRPAHIHMIVRADGYETVTTHVFDAASEYLDSDAVFAVKPSLLREIVPHAAEDPRRPEGVEGEWATLACDFVLVAGDDPHEPTDPGRTA